MKPVEPSDNYFSILGDSIPETLKDITIYIKAFKEFNYLFDLLDVLQEYRQALWQIISTKIRDRYKVDRVFIYLLDRENNQLYALINEFSNNPLEVRSPADQGIIGEIATTQKIVNIPYPFDQDSIYSFLGLPIFDEAMELIGVVTLINKLKTSDHPNYQSVYDHIDINGFTAEDEQLFATIEPYISLCFQLLEQLEYRYKKQTNAQNLLNANYSLLKCNLNLDEILKTGIELLKNLIKCDRASIWILDPEKDQLWTKLFLTTQVKEIRIPSTIGFAGVVVESGKPLNIPFDLYNDPRALASKQIDTKTSYRTCSVLSMPIINQEGLLIGVTVLINKTKPGEYPPYNSENWPAAPPQWETSFNLVDQELVTTFNQQLAVVLQKALFLAETSQLNQPEADILRTLNDGVISTNKQGEILIINQAAINLLKLADHEMIRMQPIDKYVNLETGNLREWIELALHPSTDQNKERYYTHQRLLRNNGQTVNVNLLIKSIVTEHASAIEDDTHISGALLIISPD